MSETDIRKAIQIAHSNGETRLFRNNVGEGWTGPSYPLVRGIAIPNPRRVIFGLAPGSADLIGWHTIEITPDMVGCRVAVFTSIEVKTKMTVKLQPGQREWCEAVGTAGGLAGFATSPADAGRIIHALDKR